jgi:hypothetical protein
MYFKILGDITHVETFAAGSSIREISRLRRESPGSGWRTARFFWPSYTGTKLTESDAGISRSNATSTKVHENIQ